MFLHAFSGPFIMEFIGFCWSQKVVRMFHNIIVTRTAVRHEILLTWPCGADSSNRNRERFQR